MPRSLVTRCPRSRCCSSSPPRRCWGRAAWYGGRKVRSVWIMKASTIYVQRSIFSLKLDTFGDQRRHLALGTFDQNGVALYFVLHARGQRDRFLSNTRHRINPHVGLRVPKERS